MNMARGVYTPFEERFDWKEKGQQHPVPIPPVGETDPNEDGRTPLSDQKGSVSAKHDPVRYYKIPMETLRVDTITGFDLYLRIHEDGETKYVLYRAKDLRFEEKHKDRLSDSRVLEIHIRTADRKVYNRYLEDNLDAIITNPKLTEEKQSKIVYDCANNLVQEVFESRRIGKVIPRVSRMVTNTVDHLHKGTKAFHSLLRIMTHDYYTYTHSVNVCVIGIALAQKCAVKGNDLKALGSGLLLHDIGKSKIDVTILNKNGPLNGDEWRIMKTHPEVGAQLVKESRPAKAVTLQIIRQHHEKCTGRGYPLGLVGEEIHLFSKIAALADVYDALTTNRAYKGAADAYPAIHLMQQEMAEDFCPDLFEKLVLLLNIDAKDGSFGYLGRGVH